MTNKMSENDEISTTIAVRLSEIHQQLSKQQENIERIAQKLTEINLSQTNVENSHNIVTKKLSKLLYFIIGISFVYYVVIIKNYIFIFYLKPTFILKKLMMKIFLAFDESTGNNTSTNKKHQKISST